MFFFFFLRRVFELFYRLYLFLFLDEQTMSSSSASLAPTDNDPMRQLMLDVHDLRETVLSLQETINSERVTHVAIVNELSSELLDHRQLLQSLVDWSVGVPNLSQVQKQIDLQWAANELKTDERLEQVRADAHAPHRPARNATHAQLKCTTARSTNACVCARALS